MIGLWSLSGISGIFQKIIVVTSCRLVNILHHYGNTNEVWKTVKNVRRSSLFALDCGSEYTYSKWYEPLYYYEYYMISSTHMKESIKKIEIQLRINVTSEPMENVRRETIDTSGEMFIYLGFCTKNIKELSDFYINTFHNFTTKDIILSLNNRTKFSLENFPKQI